MKTLQSFSTFFLIIISVFGCATSGKMFNYQNRNMVEINKTNVNDAIQLLGIPSSRETKVNEDGDFEILKYTYAKANPSGASGRVFILEFKNDTLNAKLYNSGFEEDKTDFKYENYSNIEVKKSNKEDVLILLGDPSGIVNCPSTFLSKNCEDAFLIWIWVYTQKSKGYDTKTIKSKTITVSFDKNGIVTSVDTSKEL